jgi:PAS domain S-box-containing protein
MNTSLIKETDTYPYESVFKTLFDLSVDGIFIRTIKGEILDCNDAGYNMFGYDKGELIGRNIAILDAEEKNDNEFVSSNAITGNQYVEKIFRKKDGTCFTTEVCTKLTTIGNKKRIITYIHDLSEQKKIQEALLESRQKLEELNKTKDKFFSIIAHDLKNPLHTIFGFAHILKENLDNFDREEFKGFIDYIITTSNSSSLLLENLLQWALTQTGSIKAKKVRINLFDLIEKNIKFLNEIALKKQINLINECPGNMYIKADKDMLEFIIRNLVSNAIKFTNTDGYVWVGSEQTDHTVNVIIKDTGVGMSSKMRKSLFEIESMKKSNGTHKETGTGLGLVLCKEFITMNKGNISVKSKVGKGSTFVLEFPLGKEIISEN